MDNLGQKFRDFRKSKKISQDKLSKMSKVSRSTIIRFEDGGNIKSDNLENMLNVLGGSVDIVNDTIEILDSTLAPEMNNYLKHVEFTKKIFEEYGNVILNIPKEKLK